MKESNNIGEKLNVLYITSRFPALSMTFVANEIEAISARGNDIHIATVWDPLADHQGHPSELPFLSRVINTSFRNPRNYLDAINGFMIKPGILMQIVKLVPGHLKSPWLFIKLLAAIPKGLQIGYWAKKNNIDWIHAHFISIPTTVALIASKVSGIPFSATAHAFDITSQHPRRINGSILVKCCEAKVIITISKHNVDDILARAPGLNPNKIKVIYNGIDTNLFKAVKSKITTSNTRSVICISNLNEKKGFPFLIKAVASLIDKGEDVILDIYGEGPERIALVKLITSLGKNDRIKLRGSINQSDINNVCSHYDVFALASIPLTSGDADGLPTVLIESLAMQIPTVSTQVTGIPEIVIDGVTGICVPPADEYALAQGIKYLLDNPDLAVDMSIKGRNLVLAQFDRVKTAKVLNDTWLELLAAKGSNN